MSDPYDDIPLERRWDVRQLVEAAARQGVEVTPRAAFRAWDAHSEGMAATWLIPSSDEEVVAAIKEHCKAVYE